MKKVKLESFIIILLLLFIIVLYYLFNKNGNILFTFNIILCFLTCLKAKFSIFSLKSILINYVLIAVAFQYNTNKSYGILQMNIYPLQYATINSLALIYSVIMYIFITNSNILKKEQEKMTKIYDISNVTTIMCCIIAIIFSIVAFPDLTFTFSRAYRFQALLPGQGWNHLVIISLIILMPKFKSNNVVKFTYVFCVLWFLLHGERVDMVGLLFCCLILFATKNISKIDKNKFNKYFKYLLIICAVVISMVSIGEIRANNTSANFKDLINKILIQNTAADLGYVYNVSIKYTNDFGYLYGKTYFNYIKDLLPFSQNRNSVEYLLVDNYSSPGGAFLLSEPYMNFGILGIVVFEIIELYILSFVMKKESRYSFYLYLFLLTTTFRTSWYGLSYIETGIIYLLPIIYILINNIDKRYGYNEKKE